MLSMTGFGKAELKASPGRFTVEISTVNSRYLEIQPRLPRQFYALEPQIKSLVGEYVSRGKVYVYVGFEESDDSPVKYRLNMAGLEAYHRQLLTAKKKMKLAADITMSDLLQLIAQSGSNGDEIDLKAVWKPLERVLTQAMTRLISMRRREGAALKKDMTKRLKEIERLARSVVKLAPQVKENYRQRLQARIEELATSSPVSEARLEEEIVMYAERTDITEECTRLLSHIGEYRRTLARSQPIGKRLNFVLQELNREVNTIGAKCSDLGIATDTISLKEEIEKLREQVQNVE